MAILASSEALPSVTRALSARFEEIAPKIGFLRGFFPDAEPKNTEELMWNVTRTTETVANSVARGEIGNLNEFEKGTDKWVLPPMYREYFAVNQWKVYKRVHGDPMVDSGYVKVYLNQAAQHMRDVVQSAG
jgi:hypothetical protein